MTLLTRGESEDHNDNDYDESVINPETDEERAARLEAQRQKDAAQGALASRQNTEKLRKGSPSMASAR